MYLSCGATQKVQHPFFMNEDEWHPSQKIPIQAWWSSLTGECRNSTSTVISIARRLSRDSIEAPICYPMGTLVALLAALPRNFRQSRLRPLQTASKFRNMCSTTFETWKIFKRPYMTEIKQDAKTTIKKTWFVVEGCTAALPQRDGSTFFWRNRFLKWRFWLGIR